MKRYYSDANFLTAFLFENHEFHNAAEKTMGVVLADGKNRLLISTLVLDETWMALHRCSEESRKRSFSDFAQDIEEIVEEIKRNDKFIFIDSPNTKQLVAYAIQGARKYNLRPRDAFHYANALLWDATLLTFDSDFNCTDLDIYRKA